MLAAAAGGRRVAAGRPQVRSASDESFIHTVTLGWTPRYVPQVGSVSDERDRHTSLRGSVRVGRRCRAAAGRPQVRSVNVSHTL